MSKTNESTVLHEHEHEHVFLSGEDSRLRDPADSRHYFGCARVPLHDSGDHSLLLGCMYQDNSRAILVSIYIHHKQVYKYTNIPLIHTSIVWLARALNLSLRTQSSPIQSLTGTFIVRRYVCSHIHTYRLGLM